MIIGQTIQPTAGGFYYTPWMARNGDFGEFLLEIIDFYDTGSVGTPSLSVKADLETKNSEDVDSAVTSIGVIGPVTAGTLPALGVGAFTAKFTGAEELVRFAFTVLGLDSDEWVHLRALNISWATN